MRIFLAGATGVIGRLLLPRLIAEGHVVAGMTRSPANESGLRESGAEPVVCDVFDRVALIGVVGVFQPDIILDELTDLPDDRSQLPARALGNARIRVEGTHNLIEAAQHAKVEKFIAQSVAWQLPAGAGADAVAELERSVLAIDGVVLRYGQFYGPGTYYPDERPSDPRVHIDAAAAATIDALDLSGGILTITD
ncbi:MAG TPA: NAD-dependent epimerase/dehydratase family protein [Terrimesophilobacter sp.]|nr:NAD-dependent epimerase/dehydratase family protein [Terrimesophilobacter sp.]